MNRETLFRGKRVDAGEWFDGEIDDKRMAEAVFGLINEGEEHNEC